MLPQVNYDLLLYHKDFINDFFKIKINIKFDEQQKNRW